MTQKQQDTPDYVRVTLTFHEFSDDGECCIVSDGHGHGTELRTDSFLHDAEAVNPGDALPCDILREAWEDSGLTPDDAGPHDVRACGREQIEVLADLTEDQLLGLGSEMADALRERDTLETELLAVKKDYKARIDLSVSRAADAATEYRSGKRLETVSCDRFEDRTTLEIVWRDSMTGAEVQRRPMTAEERQHRFELVTPDKPAGDGEDRAEVRSLPATPAANARSCLSCRHLTPEGSEQAEPCLTCAQANSGDADNWEPRRECKTCTHVTGMVDTFPCGGCDRNPDPGHGGDEDRWAWKDVPKERMLNGCEG